MSEEKKQTRVIRSPDFAKRLLDTLEVNPLVPDKNFGQQTWLRDNLNSQFGLEITKETVRKWVTGEATPRPDKMKLVARLLEVDEGWLAFGVTPDMDFRDRQKRNVSLAGAANILLGFIQLDGNNIAFPSEKDKRAGFVDFYAIIKGAQYSVHAALAQKTDEGVRFNVPRDYEDCTVIGVDRVGPTSCAFVELPTEVIASSKSRRSGMIEVDVSIKSGDYYFGKTKLNRVKSFAERL